MKKTEKKWTKKLPNSEYVYNLIDKFHCGLLDNIDKRSKELRNKMMSDEFKKYSGLPLNDPERASYLRGIDWEEELLKEDIDNLHKKINKYKNVKGSGGSFGFCNRCKHINYDVYHETETMIRNGTRCSNCDEYKGYYEYR